MSEWVSVKKRLPERGKYVLIWDDDDIEIDYYGYHYRDLLDNKYDSFGNVFVTHWMPLPEPPTTSEEV